MISTFDLWLPILLSGVGVFIVSSIIHMLIPIHAGDYRSLPDEEGMTKALREVAPGSYMFPRAESMKECASPEMIEKFKRGPVGFMVLHPAGPPAMGKALAQWFINTLFISLFVAYIGALGMRSGADFSTVFRLTATIAFLGYGTGQITDSIWKGQAWSTTLKFAFDGLLYAVVTGAIFASLWPSAIV